MIARESVGRYYIGWRSRVLLVATYQIRLASMGEAVASDSIARDGAMTDSGQKFYKDMAGAAPPARRQDKVP